MDQEFPRRFDTLGGVQFLAEHAYIPFAEIKRAIPWPSSKVDRRENDAEHSYSLALIGATLAEPIGLDPAKVTLYATVHDFVERYAGDTSVWDKEGLETKEQREAEALEFIRANYPETLSNAIEDYDNFVDEESKFVYALDKLIPTIMIVADNGRFWKENGISYTMFLERAQSVTAQKVSVYPVVSLWHQELVDHVTAHKHRLFDNIYT